MQSMATKRQDRGNVVIITLLFAKTNFVNPALHQHLLFSSTARSAKELL